MLALVKQFVGSLFSKDLGIDLGTCNTVVYVKGQGIVLSEPTVVAIKKNSGKVAMNGQAVGNVAKEMIGRTADKLMTIRPLKDGVITDFDVTGSMIGYFIRKAHRVQFGMMPRVVIAVPSGITKVEKRAVINAAEFAGARRVFILEEPLAAAIGAKLPILDNVGSMICDIGGGTTEIAIIACGNIQVVKSLKVAGDEIDDSIINYIKAKHNLQVGEQTAERIKIKIGSAFPLEQELSMVVRGRDVDSGMPREINLTSQQIRESIKKPIGLIIATIREVLDRAQPEIAADLVEKGLVICGGGSMIRGLDKAINEAIQIPVTRADDPLTCVARGTGVVIENLDQFKITLESDEDLD